MAKAKKLPSGSWRCQVYDYTDSSGKKHYRSFTAPTKKQAEFMAAQFSAEERKSRTEMTMGEAISQYIEARTAVLSPNTIKDYRCTYKHHVPGIMKIPINSIKSEDIQKAINAEALTLSPKTIRNINNLLMAVLGVYRPDFRPNISLPQRVRIEYTIPSDDDLRRLLADVKGTEMELPILLAAFGPMRRGEICALDAKNIRGTIVHVCENMIQDGPGKWIIRHPKSYAGDRYIPFPDFVAELWQGKAGRIVDMTPTALSRRFERIQRRLGMKFRFHDLRHYSASIQHLLVPDAYILQRGGWSSDGVLKQVYRHPLADKTVEMNDKVNNYFKELSQGISHEN
jgi:integrase